MARKKNLSREDLEDVSTFEELTQKKTLTHDTNKIRLHDISIQVKCLNKKQKDLKQSIESKDVVIATGPAGTAKTYISLLTSLHIMKTQPKFKKLVLIKSLQTIKGEDVGYLPGTLWEKLEPYMYSYTGNLDKIFGNKQITQALINQGVIEIYPLAYIRGITLENAMVIIDEAQNIDLHTFKTVITRLGRNCKMVFLGDIDQIDRKNKSESCLPKVSKMFNDSEYVDSIVFTKEESVRNPIIPDLLKLIENVE